MVNVSHALNHSATAAVEILNEVNRIWEMFDMKMNTKTTKTMLVSKDVTSTKVSVKIDLIVISSYKLTATPIWDKP